MAPLDSATLPDLSDDAPTGENLENHADFGALERAAQGKPEVQYGSTVEPAVPPDWDEVVTLAEDLLQRTRDLRVLVHLAVARLHVSGLPGFATVLGQIHNLIETRWDVVHPQLDPEDDNDPMQRSNALLRLQDPAKVLRPIRDLPLAGSPRKHLVSWRDIAVATGTMEPEPGREKLPETTIRRAFEDTDRGKLAAQLEAVGVAVREVAGIAKSFDAHAGVGNAPDFKDLSRLLKDVQAALTRFQPSEEAAAEPDSGEAGGEEASALRPARAAQGFASIRSITSVSSREDALYLLDVATAYFRSNEPSSPLPLLIDRAKRLANMDFMDILRDLAPDGLSQARMIAGEMTTE